MRRCTIIAAAFFLACCARTDVYPKIPESTEFPDQGSSYRVNMTEDKLLVRLNDFLENHHTERRYRGSKDSDGEYNLITEYKPIDDNSSRVEHIMSLMIVAKLMKGGKCTVVDVSYLVKSRGIHEEIWQIEHTGITPKTVEDLQNFLHDPECEQP